MMSAMGFLVVGLGAALGAWIRWWLGLMLNATWPALPLGTLMANLIGGYVMGLVVGWMSVTQSVTPELRLFLTTGFLGGLTTFSTFSAEAVDLYQRGGFTWFGTHVLAHVVGSLLMTGLGLWTVNAFR